MGRQAALRTLGDLMCLARKASGRTLSAVARAAGVDKGHLSHVEHGRDRPSWALVSFYEDAFGTDGQLWAAYVEVCTTPGLRTRAPGGASRPRYPLVGDASEFLGDITVPDGTVMPPGHYFNKVWRIRNSGTVPWIGRWLARDGAPSGHGLPQSAAKTLLPDTQPGEVMDVVVRVRSHTIAGTAQVRWKMVDGSGWEYFPDRYDQGLVLAIVVREQLHPMIE